jgi:hypothetical protein
MDWTGIGALIAAIATALATHVKNRLQDMVTQGLKNDVAILKEKIAECEKERDQLRRRRRKPPRKRQ